MATVLWQTEQEDDDMTTSDNSSSLLVPKRLLTPKDVCPLFQEDLLTSHTWHTTGGYVLE